MDTCGICFQSVDNSVISCPACETPFHRDHLAAWLHLKHKNCPHCKYDLPTDLLENLSPKTEEEERMLEMMKDLFGGPGERSDHYLHNATAHYRQEIQNLVEHRKTLLIVLVISLAMLMLSLLLSHTIPFISIAAGILCLPLSIIMLLGVVVDNSKIATHNDKLLAIENQLES